jgi:glycosyltransferase involved in cell wall biosynthesis
MMDQQHSTGSAVHISVVSPVYRAEGMVGELVRRIRLSMLAMGQSFEIILVEDGSPDQSWVEIAGQCTLYPEVRGLRLSRNFGQHKAITAGLDHARGEWVVVMDCDLQDRPEEIAKLYSKAMEGYDVVFARRTERQDGLFKRLGSVLFYKVLNYLTGDQHDATVANFGIYSKAVIAGVVGMRESIRYLPTMIQWVGFSQTKVDVVHAQRQHGTTTYNFKRLVSLAIDTMLVNSEKPLRLTVKVGFCIALFGFGMAIWTFVNWMLGNLSSNPLGYASIVFSIWLLSGFILMTLGVVGLYVGKTFEGVKDRPIYLVRTEL